LQGGARLIKWCVDAAAVRPLCFGGSCPNNAGKRGAAASARANRGKVMPTLRRMRLGALLLALSLLLAPGE
jgi:hypothetical protein